MWGNAASFSNNLCPVCESLTHDYWKIVNFCFFFTKYLKNFCLWNQYIILQTKFLYFGLRRSAVFEWHGSFIWVALGGNLYKFLFNVRGFDLAIYTLILVLLCVHIHLGVSLGFNMQNEWYLSNEWQATVLALIYYSDTPLASNYPHSASR